MQNIIGNSIDMWVWRVSHAIRCFMLHGAPVCSIHVLQPSAEIHGWARWSLAAGTAANSTEFVPTNALKHTAASWPWTVVAQACSCLRLWFSSQPCKSVDLAVEDNTVAIRGPDRSGVELNRLLVRKLLSLPPSASKPLPGNQCRSLPFLS